MPRITIDNQTITVPDGTTILQAARQLGIDIPTLCHLEGCTPSTSCMVCIVKINGRTPFLPACATKTVDGMTIESETDELRLARRTALELLLSDHLGDCLGPCHLICPARMNIPLMIRQFAAGNLSDAIATVKNDIALPAVLGRICPAPCEKGCRRGQLDDPVAICLLKRYVADIDLTESQPYQPKIASSTGKNVAIIGAGPAGLAAAYYLQAMGHQCTLFDRDDALGGKLRTDVPATRLPRTVLDAEIETILRLGVIFKISTRIPDDIPLRQLQDEFHAVLIATGKTEPNDNLTAEYNPTGKEVHKSTQRTALPNVFLAGDALTSRKMAVWSVASGKNAAILIDQFLRDEPLQPAARPFNSSIGRLREPEIKEYQKTAAAVERVQMESDARQGLSDEQAAAEASRCLHCDCRKYDDCKLRIHAERYLAKTNSYKTERRTFIQNNEHSEIIYEPGKCIDCGLCIQIAANAKDQLGLTFIGRGFDVRVAAPFNESLAQALARTGAQCTRACPTGALAFRE